jgi:hypothetical protein
MVQRTGAWPRRLWPAGGRAWLLLRGLLQRAEPIELVARQFNFLPHRFRWRGDLWRVRAVARVWEQPRSGARPPRRYFEVICGHGGSYVLFQDLQVGTWHMSL